jgi:hypothetical protein
MEKSDSDVYKEMAELYFKLYTDCIKYKKQKDKPIIDCDRFYKDGEIYANKTINNKVN